MTTMTQTTTQTTPPTNPPALTTTKAQLISTSDQTFKWSHGGGGGGGDSRGGDSGGEGRPRGPPVAPPLLPNALVPIPPAADMQAMGNKPESFYRDRAKADTFIKDIKVYLRLNKNATGYNSPKNKIAFTTGKFKAHEFHAFRVQNY
jgi:hypothetical protein